MDYRKQENYFLIKKVTLEKKRETHITGILQTSCYQLLFKDVTFSTLPLHILQFCIQIVFKVSYIRYHYGYNELFWSILLYYFIILYWEREYVYVLMSFHMFTTHGD